MKRSVKLVKAPSAIENTPVAVLLILLGVLALAPAARAGIADSPLTVLVAGKKTFHVYSVPGINPGAGPLSTFFSCTSTDTVAMQVGVELFASVGGGVQNDPVGTSLSVGPGAAGISINSNLGDFSDKGSARIIATSKKLACTAFVADNGNNPPTSMVYLTIIKKTTQKGE